MRKRRDIVLKAFLNRCPQEKRDALIRFLPEVEQEEIANLPDLLIPDEITDNPFHYIHWSWFLPTLESYPVSEQKKFLRVLNSSSQKNLTRILKINPTNEKISSSGYAFLRQTLLQSIEKDNVLPRDLLPPSPLNALLQMGKKKLTQLIDFLSLYDLSSELRQIVETKILKKIYSFLSEEEIKFIKAISGQKEPYPPAKISLEQWDGTEKTLRLTLHRIGLARFGSALAGQDPDLIWHVCHELDIGRGKALEKLSAKEAMPGVAEWLIEQMKELL